MKRILICVLAMTLCFALCACGEDTQQTQPQQQQQQKSAEIVAEEALCALLIDRDVDRTLSLHYNYPYGGRAELKSVYDDALEDMEFDTWDGAVRSLTHIGTSGTNTGDFLEFFNYYRQLQELDPCEALIICTFDVTVVMDGESSTEIDVYLVNTSDGYVVVALDIG